MVDSCIKTQKFVIFCTESKFPRKRSKREMKSEDNKKLKVQFKWNEVKCDWVWVQTWCICLHLTWIENLFQIFGLITLKFKTQNSMEYTLDVTKGWLYFLFWKTWNWIWNYYKKKFLNKKNTFFYPFSHRSSEQTDVEHGKRIREGEKHKWSKFLAILSINFKSHHFISLDCKV